MYLTELCLEKCKLMKVITLCTCMEICVNNSFIWGRRGRDRMVVGFTIYNYTCAISAYHL